MTGNRRSLSTTSLVLMILALGTMAALLAWAGPTAGKAVSSPAATASGHSIDRNVKVGTGMAGVTIGMTRSQVRRILGRPRAVDVQNAAFGPGKPVRYRYRGLRVLFWKGAPRTPSGSKGPDLKLRVAAVNTVRKSLRTRRDIGVGSTESQVRRKVKGERCQNLKWGGRRVRNCHVGSYQCETPSWALGDLPCRVTAFVLNRKGGRVVRIAVGWLGAPNGTL